MKNKKYTMSQYLKFIIPSVLGVVGFLIPITYGGKTTTIVSIVCDIIAKYVAPIQDILCLAFMAISFGLATVTILCKPKFILNNPTLNSTFNIKPAMLLPRLLALLFVISYQFQLGPEFVWNKDTGGQAYYITITVLTLMIGTAFLISLLMDFGIMDFVGTLIRRIMYPLFKLPGRSALDCIASWVGSSLVGTLLTSQSYKQGGYTKREAAVIITCFSTAGINLIYVMSAVGGIDGYYSKAMLAIYTAVVVCAFVIPRIFPLNKIKDEYNKGYSAINEAVPEGSSKFQWAIDSAVARSKDMTTKKFFTKGCNTMISVWFDVLPMIMFLSTVGMVIAVYTPVFQIITKPLVPILNFMGIAEAEKAAPMLIVGFLDQFLPVAMLNSLTDLSTKFFVFCVGISQIIYLSDMGIITIQTKLDVGLGKLFLVFIERTLISMVIIWGMTVLLI